ncbi:MAG: putative phosphoribosyl transferase [Actinomycetota bacterium]|nr:putative phosphoribosyl transferase [Actinomycetota bacterium]
MFADRADAGRQLARHLIGFAAQHPVILALPRGGVPVAAEVARALGVADLDVLVVRKIGAPWNPEYGLGAVGEGDVAVIDTRRAAEAGVDEATLARVRAKEAAEVLRRVARYRAGRPAAEVAGRTVVLVDDGIATGSTLLAAVALLRGRGAGRVVVAAPVASDSSVAALRRVADEVLVVEVPRDFRAVGVHYRTFDQVTDAEVIEVLAQFHADAPAAGQAPPTAGHRTHGVPSPGDATASEPPSSVDAEVSIPVGRVHLPGHLSVPADAAGVVIFVHGSGSSRLSPRNVAVAHDLQRRGLGTLLFDLLTRAEADDRRNVFDIDLLADRLLGVTDWLRDDAGVGEPRTTLTHTLPIGYFGASTGGGAALVAAARSARPVAAVVSRGGRPDLADGYLPRVTAPTLLLVGGRDAQVLDLNRQAQARLTCPNELVVVPGATHLFEEPGTLEQVSRLAADWFARWFT